MKRSFGLVLFFAFAACRQQQAFTVPEPGLERMQTQMRVDPFEPGAMRKAPEGTAPIERVPEAKASDSQIPVQVDAALMQRGRDRFDVFCAACHGVAGDGESVAATSMTLRAPPSLHEARIRAFDAARMERVITQGYGLMPSYARALSQTDRWAVVAYVQALQLSRHAELAQLPDDARADAVRELR